MRPLTDHTPKPLLQVGGKPLIFWHLDKLAAAGFGSVIINHAHLGRQIESTVGDGARWGLRITYSPEGEALETAGGIRNALDLISRSAFAVVNADVYSDYDYARLRTVVTDFETTDVMAHLVLVDNPPHHPRGDFCLQQGCVLETGAQLFTFSGMGVYRNALFAHLAPGSRQPLAPLLRAQMSARRVTGEHYPGLWTDVGTPERLGELDAKLGKESGQT